MGLLSKDEPARLQPAETAACPSPPIFGLNSTKMYNHDIKRAGLERDRVTQAKARCEENGCDPSNLRCGSVLQG